MNENLIEDIKELGLNSYEAKIYLALIERDSLSVSEVSKLSKVPRARAYDILDTLVTRGLATLWPGEVRKYSAADPDSLRERLLLQSGNHYANQQKTIERVALTLKKKFKLALDNKATRENPLDYIEIIKDPFQSHKRYMELTGKAEFEILGFDKPPYTVNKELIREQATQQHEIIKVGKVKLKSIHEIPKDKDQIRWKLEKLSRDESEWDENRVIAELPMKMVIFDEKIVIFQLKDHLSVGESFTSQIIEHPALAQSLKITFKTLWEKAEDYHVLEDLLKKMT